MYADQIHRVLERVPPLLLFFLRLYKDSPIVLNEIIFSTFGTILLIPYKDSI